MRHGGGQSFGLVELDNDGHDLMYYALTTSGYDDLVTVLWWMHDMHPVDYDGIEFKSDFPERVREDYFDPDRRNNEYSNTQGKGYLERQADHFYKRARDAEYGNDNTKIARFCSCCGKHFYI